jgi:TrpR-related protein YerC/YecD
MINFKFNTKTDDLFNAILLLKNTKEAESFFRDLCTIDEIREMTERWAIAKMVAQGVPYRKISEELNVSTTTVTRVALWLNNGEGGYNLVLERLGLNPHADFESMSKKNIDKEKA